METHNEIAAAGTMLRITSFGTLSMGGLERGEHPGLSNALPVPPDKAQRRGTALALTLLKLLLCQPSRFASRDLLMETLWPDSSRGKAQARLDDTASVLRTLLRSISGSRENLLPSVHSSKESGNGYHLAPYPLVWVDADAFLWNAEQAVRMERFGDDPLPYWERAYALASRGMFLTDEPYSEWAVERRELLTGQYRQCVHQLARLSCERGGQTQAEQVLRTYVVSHRDDEDALRPLMELLGAQERYQEALEHYEHTRQVLALDGHEPDARTRDIAEYVRTKGIKRERAANARALWLAEPRRPLQQHALHTTLPQIAGQDPFPRPGLWQHASDQRESLLMLLAQQATVSSGQLTDELVEAFSALSALPLISGQQNDSPASNVSLHLRSDETCTITEGEYPILAYALHLLHIAGTMYQWTDEEIEANVRQALRDSMSPREPGFISRRQAITFLLGVSGAVLGVPVLDSLFPVADEILPFCAANIPVCWQLGKSNLHDMRVAKALVSSYLPTLTAIVRDDSHHRRRAAELAAQCYRLRAILGYHLENLLVAEENAKQAVSYSRLAEDPDLLVTSLGLHALIFFYEDQPEKALEKCQEAGLSLDQATSAVRSYLYRMQAACEGRLGLEKRALTSLEHAYDYFFKHPAHEPPFLHAAHDHFELLLWDGITRYHIGQYDAAVSVWNTAEPLNPNSALPERVRIGFLDNLVFAELRLPTRERDLERCIRIWTEAIQRATNLKSELRFAEARRAYEEMLVAFPNEQRVKQLRRTIKRWDQQAL